MEVIPETETINKENIGGGVEVKGSEDGVKTVAETGSTHSSVRTIRPKKSLSILSNNDVARRTGGSSEISKPINQRVISQSTGLVKFSLKRSGQDPNGSSSSDTSGSTTSGSTLEKKGLPIYIPVDPPVKGSFSDQVLSPFFSPNPKKILAKDDSSVTASPSTSSTLQVSEEEELLFTYARKQREVLELKSQLEHAEKELKELEQTMLKNRHQYQPGSKNPPGTSTISSERSSKTPLRSTSASSTSSSSSATNDMASKLLSITTPMLEFKKKIQETTNTTLTASLNNTSSSSNSASPIRKVLKSKVSILNFTSNATDSDQRQSSLARKQSMLKIKQDFNDISTNFISDSKKFQDECFKKGKQFMDNFEGLGFNNSRGFLATPSTIEPVAEDPDVTQENYEFSDKYDCSHSGDLTYSSDSQDVTSIENLEGGEAVPFDL